ncbi:MAG: hypothetical protein ACOCRX_00160 [Candidatus Woesearchaeota archaeon]
MNNKKSQISTFMVLGAIIFLTISLVIYVNNQFHEMRLDELRDDQGVGGILDDEPINNYIHHTLRDSSRLILERIGLKGGVLDYDGDLLNDQPHLNDGVKFGSINSPYWLSLEQNNNGVYFYDTKKPALDEESLSYYNNYDEDVDSIQKQLEENIAEDFMSRLSFEDFEHLYDINIHGDAEAEVTITENDVVVDMSLPVDIMSHESETERYLNSFSVTLDVPLKNMYDAAYKLSELESKNAQLTKRYWNLLSHYMRPEEDLLPPISYTEFFRSSPLFWQTQEVKEFINGLSSIYIPQFRIFNSLSENNFINAGEMNNMESVLTNGFLASLNIHLGNELYPFNIDFIHPGENFVELNKGEQLITADESHEGDIMSLILNLGYRNYRTIYDITNPLLIKFNDPDALDGRGYTFSFGLQLNVRNNQPIDKNYAVPLESYNRLERLSSNEESRTDRDLIIEPDNPLDEDLTETKVSYRCGNNKYTLGYFIENDSVELKSPYCAVGGEVTLEKEGVVFENKRYNNIYDSGKDTLKPLVYPLKLFEVQFKKIKVTDSKLNSFDIADYQNSFIRYSKDDNYCDTFTDPLKRIECIDSFNSEIPTAHKTAFEKADVSRIDSVSEAMSKLFEEFGDEINFNRNTQDLTRFDRGILTVEMDFSSDVPIPPSLTFSKEIDTMQAYFIPGVYSANSLLISNKTINIPSECAIGSWPGSSSCIFHELPELELDSFVLGDSDFVFEITEEEFVEKNTITFYVLEKEAPSSYDDLKGFSKDSQDLYGSLIQPILSEK